MGRKIYPYLIEEQKINDYYKTLFNKKYSLRFFESNKDENIYKSFLPTIRNYMFWTFDISDDNMQSNNKKEFEKMSAEMKCAVCNNYKCNIFENNETTIVCFKNGICFAITDEDKKANKAKEKEIIIKMESINLRSKDTYNVTDEMENNEAILFLYILQLYKMIFMSKVQKDIQQESKFHKTRRDFVLFIEKIYSIKATDKKEMTKLCKKWEEDLDIEKLCVNIDNEFDILYKNNKLNENINYIKMGIILLVIAIIVGIVNLWGMI